MTFHRCGRILGKPTRFQAARAVAPNFTGAAMSGRAADSDIESSTSSDSPPHKRIVGKAVQNLFWADVKHRVVKKSRHLALATRTLLQAHNTSSSGRLTNKFDKRVGGRLQSFEKHLDKHTKETSLLREHAKLKLLETSAPLRAEFMEKLRELMKERVTADPDMWECVKGCYESLIDIIWEDVEKEIELNVELAWLKSAECQERAHAY